MNLILYQAHRVISTKDIFQNLLELIRLEIHSSNTNLKRNNIIAAFVKLS